jgi:hypothetical protein
MRARFWLQDASVALDGLVKVEVAYVDEESSHTLSHLGQPIPVVTVGRATLLPALQPSDTRPPGVPN